MTEVEEWLDYINTADENSYVKIKVKDIKFLFSEVKLLTNKIKEFELKGCA
jgi:hypothetical protein